VPEVTTISRSMAVMSLEIVLRDLVVEGMNSLEVSAVVVTGSHTIQIMAHVPLVEARVRASGKVTTFLSISIDPLITIGLHTVMLSIEVEVKVDMTQLNIVDKSKGNLVVLQRCVCNSVNIGVTGDIDIEISDLPSLGGLEETLAGFVKSSIVSMVPSLIQEHCGSLIKNKLNNIIEDIMRKVDLEPAHMTSEDLHSELEWLDMRAAALRAELESRGENKGVALCQSTVDKDIQEKQRKWTGSQPTPSQGHPAVQQATQQRRLSI